MVEWLSPELAQSLTGVTLVWVSFDGEVWICQWDETKDDGYNWRSAYDHSDYFRTDGSLWAHIDFPHPADSCD